MSRIRSLVALVFLLFSVNLVSSAFAQEEDRVFLTSDQILPFFSGIVAENAYSFQIYQGEVQFTLRMEGDNLSTFSFPYAQPGSITQAYVNIAEAREMFQFILESRGAQPRFVPMVVDDLEPVAQLLSGVTGMTVTYRNVSDCAQAQLWEMDRLVWISSCLREDRNQTMMFTSDMMSFLETVMSYPIEGEFEFTLSPEPVTVIQSDHLVDFFFGLQGGGFDVLIADDYIMLLKGANNSLSIPALVSQDGQEIQISIADFNQVIVYMLVPSTVYPHTMDWYSAEALVSWGQMVYGEYLGLVPMISPEDNCLVLNAYTDPLWENQVWQSPCTTAVIEDGVEKYLFSNTVIAEFFLALGFSSE